MKGPATTRHKVFRQQLVRIVLVPLAVLLVAFAVLEWNVRQLSDAFGWVDHTDVAISQARLVLRSIIDQESGLRGYLLTRDTRFLEHYRQLDDRLPKRFDDLRNSVLDSPEQTARVDAIRASYDLWRAYTARALQAVERKDPVTSSIDFNLEGKDLIDNLRRRQEDFVRAEDKLREARVRMALKYTRIINWSAGALAAIFGLALLFETRRNVRIVDSEYGQVVADLRDRASELRENRERLQVTLSSIGDGVIVTDASGRVNFLNAVAQELTQFSNDQAQGRRLEEVFPILHEETRTPVESPVAKVIRHDAVIGLSNHTLLLRPDGSEIFIDDRGAPIRSESGELLGVVLVFRDVTQQRRTMDALRNSEKLAVAGRLSASIAHEIHNPLDAVMNLLYLIENSAARDVEQTRMINLAQQELLRVVQVTKGMLGLYRESREPIEVKLAEVVESVGALLESQMRRKRVRFSKLFAGEGAIMGFPAEIRQVVSNLIANAIDAVPPGGAVEVSIADANRGEGGAGIVLTVRDDGPGIAQDNLKHLFRPFYTTKGEKGTGLGLWISQGIVEKHGGHLEVESSSGAGACFKVFLPRAQARERAVAGQQH